MADGEGGWGWQDVMPIGSAGLTALGAIFNWIQQQQRNKQMEELRRYYMDPNQATARANQYMNWMMPAAKYQLSQLVGNAASRGWSGYPAGLASLIPQAYAPYQNQALQMALGLGGNVNPFTTQPPGPSVNPFDAFARALATLGKGGVFPPPTSREIPINTEGVPMEGVFPWMRSSGANIDPGLAMGIGE